MAQLVTDLYGLCLLVFFIWLSDSDWDIWANMLFRSNVDASLAIVVHSALGKPRLVCLLQSIISLMVPLIFLFFPPLFSLNLDQTLFLFALFLLFYILNYKSIDNYYIKIYIFDVAYL